MAVKRGEINEKRCGAICCYIDCFAFAYRLLGKSPEKTGVIAEQILNGNDGEIHYSYYLPEDYDGSKTYPLVLTMPGYGMMWFGEDSSGSNMEYYRI